MKTCRTCKKDKKDSEFYHERRVCKKCVSKKARQTHLKRHEQTPSDLYDPYEFAWYYRIK